MGTIGPVMFDIASTELSEEDINLMQSELCGGVILFSRNIESPEQVLRLTQSIKAINPSIIIAVDQEGGRVQRLIKGFTRLPRLSVLGEVYATDQKKAGEYAFALGELMALEVQSVGCDISFAPVLDVGELQSQVIGDRAFSINSQEISTLGEAYIAGMKKAGMAATGKHFPGHGSVVEDSHVDIPYDDRDYETINSKDLLPFVNLKNDLSAMMPAHIIYSKIDSLPAGFSQKWLQQILRQKIGFNGVIFSDDITMQGATVVGSYGERASKALLAGCDMVLVCNNRTATIEVLKTLKDNPPCSAEARILSESRLRDLLMSRKPTGLNKLTQTEHWQMLVDVIKEINE